MVLRDTIFLSVASWSDGDRIVPLLRIKQASEKIQGGYSQCKRLVTRVCKIDKQTCCVEESKYCGSQCHIIKDKYSRYKLYWSRNSKSTACVGVLVAEKWIVKVLEVE